MNSPSCANCLYRPTNASETLFQVEGRFLCTKCYQAIYTCPGCQKIVTTSYLPVGPTKWHPTCYNAKPAMACARCSTASSPTYYEIEGKNYCAACTQMFPACSGCGVKITDAYYPIDNLKYHKKCFEKASDKLCCNLCRVPFGQNSYLSVDGKNLCQTCAQMSYACAKCHAAIVGEFVLFEGQRFHPHCKVFFCPGCRQCISGDHILVSGERWHEKCYNSLNKQSNYQQTMGRILEKGAKPTGFICTQCQEEIIGEYVMVGNQHRHPHCFGPRDGGLHRLR